MWKHDKGNNMIDVTLATKANNKYIGWAQNDKFTANAQMVIVLKSTINNQTITMRKSFEKYKL